MEEKTSQNNYWKIGFFGLIAAVVVGANILAWYFFVKGKPETPTLSPTSSPVTTIIVTPTPKETVIPSPIPTVDETNLIRQAIFKLTGLDGSRAEVTISKNTGKHAKGSIKEFEAVGGAYFIAAKTADGWIGVYAGQANPTCNQIAPYNFPNSLVTECLDASGNVVKR